MADHLETDPTYRWSHPGEWLKDHIIALSAADKLGDLEQLAHTLAEKLDGDQIQDEFQSEMDVDGYFTPESADDDSDDDGERTDCGGCGESWNADESDAKDPDAYCSADCERRDTAGIKSRGEA